MGLEQAQLLAPFQVLVQVQVLELELGQAEVPVLVLAQVEVQVPARAVVLEPVLVQALEWAPVQVLV